MVCDEGTEVNFCDYVAEIVKRKYGMEDGADICFNLLESGRIPEDATLEEAARIVFHHNLKTLRSLSLSGCVPKC